MDSLLLWDQELFLWLNSLGSEPFDAFWMTVTDKRYTIGLYAILTAVMSKRLGWKNTLWMLLVITLLITFTDQVTNLFKDGFKRLRPCHEAGLSDIMRQVKPGCGGKYGYFSGHASNSMAAAVFGGLILRPYFKSLIFILLFWSAMVAYSRIYVGVHFPIDIICGMIFGAISGYLFYKLSGVLIQRFIKA